jgi:heat shock protein HtpX
MISALRRLKSVSDPQPLPDEMAAFGISGAGLKELVASHPPPDDRIRALEQAK